MIGLASPRSVCSRPLWGERQQGIQPSVTAHTLSNIPGKVTSIALQVAPPGGDGGDSLGPTRFKRARLTAECAFRRNPNPYICESRFCKRGRSLRRRWLDVMPQRNCLEARQRSSRGSELGYGSEARDLRPWSGANVREGELQSPAR